MRPVQCWTMKTAPQKTALGFIATLWLLGGCAPHYSFPITPQKVSSPKVSRGRGDPRQLLKLLYQVIGTPYRYGGDTPRMGFDCSGLVFWVSHKAGYFLVPRTVREQYQALPHVPLNHLRPGDILFFRFHHGPPTHDALYLGHHQFIHAPQTGGKVRIASLQNPFWSHHLIAAARFFR